VEGFQEESNTSVEGFQEESNKSVAGTRKFIISFRKSVCATVCYTTGNFSLLNFVLSSPSIF
jgi:hypothetical protein